MREKMFSIGEGFGIENQAGERAFRADGKALRLRDTLILAVVVCFDQMSND